MQQKEVILEGTIKAFNEKGLKFTMDDVAKILGMSKKTIYTVFRDKESMFLAMVDYMFDPLRRVNSRSWRTMRYLRWRRSDGFSE